MYRFFLLFLSCLCLLVPKQGIAANELPDGCDSEFYDIMKDVSWKNAQRETEMAQRIILKPDSVLEYTCFNKILGKVDGTSSVAIVPWYYYLKGNFNYDPAGGTYDEDDPGDDVYPKDPASTCYTMDLLWHILKCRGFGVDGDKDDFFRTFTELKSNDPRTYPQKCEDTNKWRANRWKDALDNTDYNNVLAE